MNSGQACAAGTRLLVPRTRLEEAKSAILTAMKDIRSGDPHDETVAVGPAATQRQYDRVQGYIHKGIEEGAEVLVGGEGHPEGLEGGFYVKPTVFVNVTNDMTIAQQEIFGPVLAVIAYDTEADAIAIANPSWPGGDQRHGRRPERALGRLQVFGLRPRVRRLRHQRLRGDARDPRSRVISALRKDLNYVSAF
jgi:acyl-CoA reductase-like NAD-dependent aldehyde dehydrogenase